MHPLYRFSHIGRPVEPRYPTNRAVLIAMAVCLVAGAGYALTWSASPAEVAWSGASAALTAFLSWALGRELAPDDNPTAFIGMALALCCWALLGKPDLLLVAGLLGTARIVNRTVGPPAKLSDAVIIVLGALAIGLGLGHTALLLAAALAFFLDAALAEPKRLHAWFGVVALLGLGAGVMLSRGWRLGEAMPAWALVIASLLVAAVIATTPAPRAHGDIRDRPLDRRRVQAAMAMVLVATVWATLAAGKAADVALLWAVMLGMVIGRAVELGRSGTRGRAAA